MRLFYLLFCVIYQAYRNFCNVELQGHNNPRMQEFLNPVKLWTSEVWNPYIRNIWRHISLIWPFPHRYRHSPWLVDVTEQFPRFCCWRLIWLSSHWAWLRRGYWRYRSLIDALIYWFIGTPLISYYRLNVSYVKELFIFYIVLTRDSDVNQCVPFVLSVRIMFFLCRLTCLVALYQDRANSVQKNQLPCRCMHERDLPEF